MSAFDACRTVVFLGLWAGWTVLLISEDRGPVLSAIIAVGPVIGIDRWLDRQRSWRDPQFAPEPDSIRFVLAYPVGFTVVFVGIAWAGGGFEQALGWFWIIAGAASFLAVVGLLGRRRTIRRRRELGLPLSGSVDKALTRD